MGFLNCLTCGLKNCLTTLGTHNIDIHYAKLQNTLYLQIFTRTLIQLCLLGNLIISPYVNQMNIALSLTPCLLAPVFFSLLYPLIIYAKQRQIVKLRNCIPGYILIVILEFFF